MDLRTILVPVSELDTGQNALRSAIPIAKQFNAHITAMHVRFDPTMPMPYVAGPMPSDMLTHISVGAIKASEEQSERLKLMVADIFKEHQVPLAATQAAGSAPGVSGLWVEISGSVDYGYGAAGRLHDLAIVPVPSEGNDLLTDILEGMLFYSGRPVLMMPDNILSGHFETIMIAWNGSREGVRALTASLPFLKRASRVIILTVGSDVDGVEGPTGDELAGYLAWHGVLAEVVTKTADGMSNGMAIVKATETYQANLLVSGAYSHSRLREMFLGGVTHDVIEHARVPVLFGH